MNEPDVVVGQQIDNYRISRQIGQGGMAAVYLARDIALDRDVVIKMMLPLWLRTKSCGFASSVRPGRQHGYVMKIS